MARRFSNQSASLEAKLLKFSARTQELSGISGRAERKAFVLQLISSLRRVEYVRQLSTRKISPERLNTNSEMFDPLRGAILLRNKGLQDEAIWLVFLATHFGKHKEDGWRLLRDIYGALGPRPAWTWAAMTKSPREFEKWAHQELKTLLSDNVSRRFSNHRKYESKQPKAIALVLRSYVEMITEFGSHREWMNVAHKTVGQNPTEAFDYLYKSMRKVARFGRLANFDFLTMLGKLDLLPITPGIAYLDGATGPLRGARLLVDNNSNSSRSAADLERILIKLDELLNVGKQVLEDAMCNWQKSPNKYVYFRG